MSVYRRSASRSYSRSAAPRRTTTTGDRCLRLFQGGGVQLDRRRINADWRRCWARLASFRLLRVNNFILADLFFSAGVQCPSRSVG